MLARFTYCQSFLEDKKVLLWGSCVANGSCTRTFNAFYRYQHFPRIFSIRDFSSFHLQRTSSIQSSHLQTWEDPDRPENLFIKIYIHPRADRNFTGLLSNMSPELLTDHSLQDDDKQVSTTMFRKSITDEGTQDQAQQPKCSTENPSITRTDMQITCQQPEVTDNVPSGSPDPSPSANPSSANPIPETSSISPLGRPPPSSKHYYLKEMWPGQRICHLCRKEYKTTNRAIRALPCGDIFHRACVDHLLGQKDGCCPSCDCAIPVDWYLPHRYDPLKPAGSPCLCHPAPKAGANTTNVKEGPSSPPTAVLAIRKVFERTKEAVIRCIPGLEPRGLYASYKTETGQTRYIEERKIGVALRGSGLGHADGGS